MLFSCCGIRCEITSSSAHERKCNGVSTRPTIEPEVAQIEQLNSEYEEAQVEQPITNEAEQAKCECTICLESIDDYKGMPLPGEVRANIRSNTITTGLCGHKFHTGCILKHWITQKKQRQSWTVVSSCPNCRQTLVSPQLCRLICGACGCRD